MEIQDEYKQKMAAQLQEWSGQINLLEASMKNKCAEELHELRVKQRAAFEKMKELRDARGEAWEHVKVNADKIWEDLKAGVAEAHSKFK
jgi:vancomycin resistance protein YoaR